jgi:hypothetical protein
MTTVSKSLLIALILSVTALAQSAPKNTPAKSQTTPSASQNGKNQKDAAAKGSASHTSNMSGNHKDIMGVAANNNQNSASHSNNMIGNHKDVMMATAPAPSSSGKTQQSGTAAQPTAPNKSTTSNPNSPH